MSEIVNGSDLKKAAEALYSAGSKTFPTLVVLDSCNTVLILIGAFVISRLITIKIERLWRQRNSPHLREDGRVV